MTTLEGKEPFVEKLFIGLLVSQVALGLYILLVLIINCCISGISFRFKLSPPKRFKTKVTPIYKGIAYEEYGCFTICKYELTWMDFDGNSYRSYLLPFASIFQRYKYKNVGSFEFDYDLDGITDLEALFEGKLVEKNKIKTEKQRQLDRIDNLNKVFKENYE